MAIRLTVEDYRADILLDRPEVLNAMNWEVFEALDRVTAELEERDDVRVVVVSGAGRSFSSGIDTTTFGDAQPLGDLIARAQAGFRRLEALPIPTIAAVRGHAYGAGMQLALVCDLRVVAADARLGLLEAKYGLIPDLGGTHRLPALAGPGVAKQMMWFAERIDGAEAHRRKIAEVTAEPDELASVVDDLARRLVAAPPLVVRDVKRLVHRAAESTFAEAMDEVASAQERIMASHDFAEAITAFMEGRDPRFRGA
ncbi:MAG: enoyl-CoA hydratase-related protein [Actinomycetota bacterium]|nr:enoyl-CoA hydratase-related protein [Actinomycetota bacterium]